MTDITETLDQWRTRLDAATEGPWVVRDGIPGPVKHEDRELERHYPLFLEAYGGDGPEDATFIAHARTDLDRAEKALRAVVDQIAQMRATRGSALLTWADEIEGQIESALTEEGADQ